MGVPIASERDRQLNCGGWGVPVSFINYQLFFKTLWFKQKVVDIYSQDTVFIIVRLHNIFGNDDFFKRIVDFSKRSDFLAALCFIRQ